MSGALFRATATVGLLVALGRLLVAGIQASMASITSASAGFADYVTLIAAVAGSLVLAWVLAVLILTGLAAIPGQFGWLAGSLSRALASGQTRRIARMVLGLSIAAGPVALAPVAHALPGQAVDLPPIGRPQVASPALPDAPLAPVVVVAPGDTLWAIAGRSLGGTASATAIAREWPRWFSANRAAIGDNPDVIHPGTVLHPPQPPR